jgi:predicted nucleotidyltransferase
LTAKATSIADPVVDFLIREAQIIRSIEKILLFGSRARGNAQERSDYDIAVFAPSMTHAVWAEWKDKLTSTAPTLLALDFVLVTPDLSESLRENINKEGRVLYVKNQT